MADPQTGNIGLAIPLRGSDVGTWDIPVNGDFTAIDGMLGGVATVGLSNAPVTLTSPYTSPAAPSPSPGPTQSQNGVIIFTGALSANVTVTLPIPAIQQFYNETTGNFLVILRAAGSGEVIAIPQGVCARVYNDGTNVRFIEGIEGRPGKMEFEGGETGLPAWVSACTKKPYLLADGSIYNFSDFPALGAKYGNKFGGNGITTFGVPDMQGRVPLAYDGTGTRITTAGCGINGQTIGAAGGGQTNTVVTANLPPYTPAGGVSVSQPQWDGPTTRTQLGVTTNGIPANQYWSGNTPTDLRSQITASFAGSAQGGTSTPINNVQPAIVAGVWLVKT